MLYSMQMQSQTILYVQHINIHVVTHQQTILLGDQNPQYCIQTNVLEVNLMSYHLYTYKIKKNVTKDTIHIEYRLFI